MSTIKRNNFESERKLFSVAINSIYSPASLSISNLFGPLISKHNTEHHYEHDILPSQQKIFIRHSVNLVLRFYDDIIENMFIQYLYNVLRPANALFPTLTDSA